MGKAKQKAMEPTETAPEEIPEAEQEAPPSYEPLPKEQVEPAADSAPEYAMIRVKEAVKARGSSGKRIAGMGSIRIFFRTEPFRHFEIQPDGTQVPVENVAAADPIKGAVARKAKAWRNG